MKENKLINEKSPYLLQHAHNPVNWYSWGEEAFKKAQQEEKPVFLSIGYSTCHWCHVMERESFEDEEVAAVLNRDFIAVKVDREERPDIDAVYMAACQAMTGSGGWPLTVLMTDKKKPFYCGTYFPKKTKGGIPGLLDLLPEIAGIWKHDREHILKAGEEAAVFLLKTDDEEPDRPDKDLAETAFDQLLSQFDEENGGFGFAPKFPAAHNLLFLLRYYVLEHADAAKAIAERTLIQMVRGGIHDHIGGGFSRYSTDEKWLVPHFEKMLYDNALLAYAYLEAYRITQRPIYRDTAERILLYVKRELTSPEGGFYCGQDADSDGIEGKYYVFTAEEIKLQLGEEKGRLFCEWFGITDKGNFEGRSIPNLLGNPNFEERWEEAEKLRKVIYEYRAGRTKLHKDDKVLTSWNALMITAYSKAFKVLGDEEYLNAAVRADQFIRDRLTGADGRLFIRYRDGEARHMGQLGDYAFCIWAQLELYSGSFEVQYLQEALRLGRLMTDLFWDEEAGGFYLYASDAEQLLRRPKELYDGAMPSGNAAAALSLVRLAAITREAEWQEYAEHQLAYLAGNIREYLAGHCFGLYAVLEMLYPAGELLCCTEDEHIPAGLISVAERYGLAAVIKTPANVEALSECVPFTVDYPIPEKGEAYYFCYCGSCNTPVSTLEELVIMADRKNQ